MLVDIANPVVLELPRSIKLSLYVRFAKRSFFTKVFRHIEIHERANNSFSNRQFDNSISDELFILSQVYVICP